MFSRLKKYLIGKTLETSSKMVEANKASVTSNRPDHFVSLKIVDCFDLTVRTANCLNSQEILYIGDLVQKTEHEMLQIPAFGRKSLFEIKEHLRSLGLGLGMELKGWSPDQNVAESGLLHSTVGEDAISLPAVERVYEHKENMDLDERIRILDFNPDLLRKVSSLELSVRALGCLKAADIFYVGDLIHVTEAELLKTPNFGRTSLKEIQEKLDKIRLQLGMDEQNWPPADLAASDINELANIYERYLVEQNNEGLLEQIQGLLSDKEYDVISRRFALESKVSQTLEEISKDYNCTRERIRQIENKSLRKIKQTLKLACQKYYDEQALDADNILFDSAGFIKKEDINKLTKQLDGLFRLVIECLYGSFRKYLDKDHISYDRYWLRGSLNDDERKEIQALIDSGSTEESVESLIYRALRQFAWPVEVDKIIASIPEYPAEVIAQALENKCKVEVQDNKVIKIPAGLRANQRLALIFKRAGRALKPSEVRPMHNEMFGEDMTEHAIGAVLGRLDDALIVDRGVYNTYDNIHLSFDDLSEIRQSVYELLKEKQAFLSAGVIYRSLYLGKHSYGADFTKYMLYGILQDDPRFIYKRGLMLGLKEFPEDLFTSLTEQVQNVVEQYGPVKIREIQTKLSSERHVLDVTIGMMLDSSEHCIKIGPSEYDAVDRVLGSKSKQLNLTYAIQIALLSGVQTLHSLRNRLAEVGIQVDDYPLCSWIDMLDNIRREKNIIELLAPDSIITSYDMAFNTHHFPQKLEESKKAIALSLKPEEQKLLQLDYRLSKNYGSPISREEDELDIMLNDLRL